MRIPIHRALTVAACLCVLVALAGCRSTGKGSEEPPPRAELKTSEVVVAFTAPAEHTALFESLAPAFEREHPHYTLEVVASTDGEAMALAESGGADALLIHSPAADAFAADGRGTDPRPVMHDGYIIVGPPADPARARGTGALEALKRIAVRQATFISRGDDSATYAKEVLLWGAAGIDPKGPTWYVTTGQDMDSTLRVADERRGYTLVDRATWYSMQGAYPNLVAHEVAAPELQDPYSVVKAANAKNPGGAAAFASWITSPGGQAVIGSFRVQELGAQTLVPSAPQ